MVTDNILNIDFLKQNKKRLYYFGLGFIQLTLNDEERVHFYTDTFPTITESIHNHRYNFRSKIIKGTFFQTLYDLKITDSGNYILVNESCNKEVKAPKLELPCSIQALDTYKYTKNDIYGIKHYMFHTVSAKDGTITYIKRSSYSKDYAQIVTNGSEICPFSLNIPEGDLWNDIERIIND